jgi:hypothetical protein
MEIINNAKDFEFVFKNTFGDISRSDLLYKFEEDNVLQIELGGQGKDVAQRLEQAFVRSNTVLQYCLGGKSIWLRMIFWTNREEKNLADAGFKIHKAAKIIKQKVQFERSGEYEVLYIHFKRYLKVRFSSVVRSILNYDMVIEPSAQITCYYINFKSKLIINIYDDRGLSIYTPNKELLKKIKDEFFDWLI